MIVRGVFNGDSFWLFSSEVLLPFFIKILCQTGRFHYCYYSSLYRIGILPYAAQLLNHHWRTSVPQCLIQYRNCGHWQCTLKTASWPNLVHSTSALLPLMIFLLPVPRRHHRHPPILMNSLNLCESQSWPGVLVQLHVNTIIWCLLTIIVWLLTSCHNKDYVSLY